VSCLHDRAILIRCEKDKLVQPFDIGLVQPASYELTFDASLVYQARDDVKFDDVNYVVKDRQFRFMSAPVEEVHYETLWERAVREVGTGGVLIMPGGFYIASSKEKLKIPSDLMARFEGKSTLGRVGMMVHITAGYIDPGFEGTLTLEIANVAPWPILLQDGDKIGQLSFHKMEAVPTNIYGQAGNHYQGQVGPTLPR
jgi:dCTP deaminase